MQRNLLHPPSSARLRRIHHAAGHPKFSGSLPFADSAYGVSKCSAGFAPEKIASASGSRFRSSPAARREYLLRAVRPDGGRGRIRTSVARKERQIYSLLVLATHPPVRTGGILSKEGRSACAKFVKTQRHSYTCFAMQEPASRDQLGISPDSKNFGRAGGGI